MLVLLFRGNYIDHLYTFYMQSVCEVVGLGNFF